MQAIRRIKGCPHVVKLGTLTITRETADALRLIHDGASFRVLAQAMKKEVKRVAHKAVLSA